MVNKKIVVDEMINIMLTVPGEFSKTCVYVHLENNKLVFSGGASIIERIEGKGMIDKIKV